MVYKFPFEKRAYGKIYKIPEANEQISPLPNFRYVIYPLHLSQEN
jgi:hypothetical protein